MKYYLVQYRLQWVEMGFTSKTSECEMFEFENSLTPLECFKSVKGMLEIKHPADMDGKIDFLIENMTFISQDDRVKAKEYLSYEVCEKEAKIFTEKNTECCISMLSEDYIMGYKEGIEHYLLKQNGH